MIFLLQNELMQEGVSEAPGVFIDKVLPGIFGGLEMGGMGFFDEQDAAGC